MKLVEFNYKQLAWLHHTHILVRIWVWIVLIMRPVLTEPGKKTKNLCTQLDSR